MPVPGYELDDDAARIDVGVVVGFLGTEAYWHRWRTPADVERQLAAAWRVVGAYETATGTMVGFARAVSDGVAIAYLSDVFVLAAHRGRGLGAALLEEMIERGPGAEFRWMLHTADAHALYARFGFAAPGPSTMERPGARPSVGGPSGGTPGPDGGSATSPGDLG